MTKWNIDRELGRLEPKTAAGTRIDRALVPVEMMRKLGIKPTPEQVERGHGNIWCVSLGILGMPKAFFYGQTIREAFLKARKAAKAKRLDEFTPWGSQPFKPNFEKKRRMKKKARASA